LKLGSEGDQKKEKKEEKPTAPLSTPPSGPSTPPQTLAPPFPAYLPAQYLTTFDEYLPADPNALAADTAGRVKQLSAGEAEEKERELQQQSGAGAGGKKGAAGGEQWEKVLPKGVDEVFERFLERLNRAEDGSGQVLRYDLGAVPLPYSSNSDLFKRLFKRDAGEDGVDEDDLEPDVNVFGKRYDPTGVVPNCPRCGGERTFEMQLVPGLIAELKTEHLSLTGDKKRRGGNKKKKQQTEEERRRELAVLLGRASANDLPKPADDGEDERTPVEREEDRLRGETGMEWGTIMVFGCERDCVGFGEEWVGVEWEEMQ
jgi:pre-rRNA-processing protein TSR4